MVMHMWSIDYQYKNCNPEFDTGEKEMIKYYAQKQSEYNSLTKDMTGMPTVGIYTNSVT